MLISHRSMRNAGFTLIEIMIAVLILSFGMLGIAGLQVAGIKSSQTASIQTHAALETSNLIARMRSNPEYWKKGTSDLDIDVSEAGEIEVEETCDSLSESCDSTTISLDSVDDKNCRSEICTSTEIAKYDVQQWGTRLVTLMPFRGGAIAIAGNDGMMAIELSWLEESAREQGREEHSYQVKIKL